MIKNVDAASQNLKGISVAPKSQKSSRHIMKETHRNNSVYIRKNSGSQDVKYFTLYTHVQPNTN